MALLLVFGAGVLVILWMLCEPWLRERRRERLRGRPFPDAWREILVRRVPYFGKLPHDLQRQLEAHIQVFVAEKPFIGCGGLAISDEIRVTIAAQACLLILNRQNECYPKLRQILVYPGPFVVNRVQMLGGGVLQDQRHVLAGESWTQGQVILSWEDTIEGAAVPDDGRNIVIHEFAHQLDQEKGDANGAPAFASRKHYETWSRTLGEAYTALQAQVLAGESSLIAAYGATAPAEFFAVASEVFFEQPQLLAALHPALYRELAGFYRVNPSTWKIRDDAPA